MLSLELNFLPTFHLNSVSWAVIKGVYRELLLVSLVTGMLVITCFGSYSEINWNQGPSPSLPSSEILGKLTLPKSHSSIIKKKFLL